MTGVQTCAFRSHLAPHSINRAPSYRSKVPQAWTREQPFTASLSVRQKITSRNAEKNVEHIEIDLSDSGIQYQPGDALGVWPVNAPDLVSEILSLHRLKGDETVQLADGTSTDIRHALTHHVDITQNTPSFQLSPIRTSRACLMASCMS